MFACKFHRSKLPHFNLPAKLFYQTNKIFITFAENLNMADKKKAVGRPVVKGLERKETRTVSITPSIEKKAKRYFKTLGKAVEFAVVQHELLNLPLPNKK